MRSLDILLIVAVLLQSNGTSLEALPLTAHNRPAPGDVAVTLMAGDVAASEVPVGQKEMKLDTGNKIVLCMILGFVGSVSGCAGVGIMLGTVRSQQCTASVTGDDARQATATITSKKSYTTTSRNSDGVEETSYHYEVSYWFEAVRGDGMRCRITVKDREVGHSVFESCPEGGRLDVYYVVDEPRHCRLTQAAENDKKLNTGNAYLVRMGVGLSLAAFAVLMALIIPTLVTGSFGIFISAPLCFGLVACCILGCVRPMIDNSMAGLAYTTLEELGMQENTRPLLEEERLSR